MRPIRMKPSDLFLLLLAATVVAAAAGSCGGSNQVLGNTGSGAGSTGSSMGGAQSNGTMSTASMSTASMGTATMSNGSTSTGSMSTSTSTGTGGGVSTIYPCMGCPTFPPPGTPTCTPATLGAPTIAYPLDGLLLPPNMNVLEVQFVPPAGATLFEVDFTNAITSVKVETMCNPITPVRGGSPAGCGITLPQAAWNDIANTNRDGDPVQVTVRATNGTGSCVATSTANIKINFAKDDIVGGIYYWQSATYGGIGGKTGGIYSHDFGSFDPTPTPFYQSGTSGTCVGCHFLSRDGVRISLTFDDPDGDDEFGDEKSGVLDVATRTGLGAGAGAMGQLSPGFQTFTHDHGKMITSTFKPAMTMPMLMSDQGFAVYNTSGTTISVLAGLPLPTGMQGTQPDLSALDNLLAFVVPQAGTISMAGDHHFLGGSIYTAPFNTANNTLGTPTVLLASTGTLNNYYPNISPDGNFIVFNQATPSVPLSPDAGTTSNADAFYARNAQVMLLHLPGQAGAQPISLAKLNVANGLTNSWPRWSPYVQTYKGHQLLWVTFSSNRDYGLHLSNEGFDNCYPPESPMYDQPQPLSKQGDTYTSCAEPQIWMAGIIVDPDPSLDSGDRSFPAFWLPFQDVTAHNHSAQWVQQVQGGGTPDGGPSSSSASGTSTSTGTASSSGGSKCGEFGATCGVGAGLCCSDVLCCNGTCQYVCAQ